MNTESIRIISKLVYSHRYLFVYYEKPLPNTPFHQHGGHGPFDHHGRVAEQIERIVDRVRWWWRCPNPTRLRKMAVLCHADPRHSLCRLKRRIARYLEIVLRRRPPEAGAFALPLRPYYAQYIPRN